MQAEQGVLVEQVVREAATDPDAVIVVPVSDAQQHEASMHPAS